MNENGRRIPIRQQFKERGDLPMEVYEETRDEISVLEDYAVTYDAVSALEYSKAKFGRVNLSVMSQISGLEIQELIEQLKGQYIWQDPKEYGISMEAEAGWLFEEQYFNGKWSHVMKSAQEANALYGRFAENIEALEKRKPAIVHAEQIYAPLGSVSAMGVCSSFIQDLLDLDEEPEMIEVDGEYFLNENVGENSIKNKYTYGTGDITAIKNIKHILEGKIPTSGRNKAEVLDGIEMQQQIKSAFQKKMMSCAEKRELVETEHNQLFDYMKPNFDGSFLRLDDLNSEVKLYPYQKNAVARMILSSNVLLAHSVGAGKTYEMIVGCHEKKRMGLSEKNLVVVPNSVLDATIKTHQYLYPQDEILAVTPRNFTPTRRKEMLRKIREGNYVAIYMAHSSFDRIKLSKKHYLGQKEEAIRECKSAIEAAGEKTFRGRVLSKKLTKLQNEFWKIRMRPYDDELSCFESLGITTLVIDECHNYKNITMQACLDGVVGMHLNGSKKSDEMLAKVHFVQEEGGSIVFATGTPLTNSLADLYVLQRYLQPEELKKCKIEKFSQWLNTFVQQEVAFEIDVDSQNYRFKVRFTHFHNLPELMSMFANVCDFYDGSDKSVLPEFEGYTDITVPKTGEQKEYIENLVTRTENIRSKAVKQSEDNLLLVTIDGRKCALDIRLVKPELKVTGISKTIVCAEKVNELYHDYPGTAQLVFCDSSTPKKTFNIYDALREELMKYEIPQEEIAFIHEGTTESKRRELIQNLNAGKIRIMVGSTPKIGIGVNVQENLIAIHHLDIPWRPSDLVQREGRLIRQGNQNNHVYIFRYITEGSFDSYTWQIMENKQKFISSFLSGVLNPEQREEEDISETVLDYSEIKALAVGNPLIKKRLEVANYIEHLRISLNERQKQLKALETIIEEAPEKMAKKEKLIRGVSDDMEYYQSQKKIISMEERETFGKRLLQEVAANIMKPEEKMFEVYQGFNIVLPPNMSERYPYVIMRRENGGSYSVKMDGNKPLGCSRRLDHVLEQLPKRKETHEEDYWICQKNYQDAKADIQRGNPYRKQLEEATYELHQIDEELNAS